MHSTQSRQIYTSGAYRQMVAEKTRFVVGATAFFVIYYFAFLILVGYWPDLMKKEIWGVVNIAYSFAFSQFLVAWALAYLYMRIARRFDELADKVLSETAAGARAE